LLAQGKSFAKACDRWREQPSHSELNNVNERGRNFAHRFKELKGTSGKRDSERTRMRKHVTRRGLACASSRG
jgi:hypothetical protein